MPEPETQPSGNLTLSMSAMDEMEGFHDSDEEDPDMQIPAIPANGFSSGNMNAAFNVSEKPVSDLSDDVSTCSFMTCDEIDDDSQLFSEGENVEETFTDSEDDDEQEFVSKRFAHTHQILSFFLFLLTAVDMLCCNDVLNDVLMFSLAFQQHIIDIFFDTSWNPENSLLPD